MQLSDNIESLDSVDLDEIQQLWTAEAIRRRDEIRSGQVQAVPGKQVLNDVRRMVGDGLRFRHIETFRRRKALPITETELKLIAAAAIIGLNRIPKNG